MIIDGHCHAGLGDGLTAPWNTRAPLGRYLRRARQAGIGRTVLFPTFNSRYESANRRLAEIIARLPGRFYGFAGVHAKNERGQIERLIRTAVRDYGFRGIKVHRHDARITREICDVADKFSIPVLYDITGEFPVVELLAQEYPKVNFIIPHLGSFGDDWRAQLALIDPLARHPNIFADTSGVRRFDLLVEAARRAGARKLIFGSDGPWLHPGVELFKIRALGLSPEQENLIKGGNLARLISLADPSPLRSSVLPANSRSRRDSGLHKAGHESSP